MTDDELIARALQLLAARAAGASAPSITVAQLYERYKAANEGRKSWPVINDRLYPVVKFLADRDVMSLKVIDWSDYRAMREAQEIPTGKPGRRYGAHTINCELTWIKAMFNAGVAQGRIPHNPIAAATPVRTKSKRSTALGEADLTRLLALADARMRVVILCAADGGMRRNEVVELRWDWVDAEARCIRLPGWACKSGRARVVAATQRMLDAIEAMPRHLRSSHVLVNPDTGERYNKDSVSRWFRDLADAAGVEAAPADKRVVAHDLRRTYGTNATRRGMRIEVLSQFLGHASLDQTREYVETSAGDVVAALDVFEAGIEKDQRRGPKRADPEPPSAETEKSKRGR